MLKIYMLIIVLGLLGGVGYGAYYYYKDTQQRIQVLSENNAKLEVAAQLQEETINTMIEDREKFEQINKELQKELQTAERYGDQLRATLQKHNLTPLAKKARHIEKRMQMRLIGYGTVLLTLLILVGAVGRNKSSNCNKNSKNRSSDMRTQSESVNDVKIYVVSKRIMMSLLKSMKRRMVQTLTLHVCKRLRNLSLNFAELRRYIEQQKQIILYYEKAVTPKEKTDGSEETTKGQ